MKRKRLLCAVLALVLLFSAQPVALALFENQRSTVIQATCKPPTIYVDVPAYSDVIINPLAIPVYINGRNEERQIISTPSCVINRSDVALAVDMTVSGSINEGSTMLLASAPTGGTGTAKQAFLYFEIQQANTRYTDEVDWAPAYDPAKHILITDGGSVTKNNIMTLPAMTLDHQVADGGYAPFRLTGDAVRAPTDAWTSEDGVNVVVAFTFTPIPFES